MNKRFTSILRDKSGIALMTVVLIFLVLVLLLGATTFQAIGNLNSSKMVSRHTASFYAAESGINLVAADIEAINDNDKLTDSKAYQEVLRIRDTYTAYTFELRENAGNVVTVDVVLENFKIDTVNGKVTTTIASTGHIGDQSRTLYATIDFKYRKFNGGGPKVELPQVRHAVFVKNTIKTGNGTITSVYPNDATKNPIIATLSIQANSIDLNNGLSFPNGEIELTNPQASCANNTVVSQNFRCSVNDTILVTEDRAVTPPEVRVNFPKLDFEPIRDSVSTMIAPGSDFDAVSRITDMLSGTTFNSGAYLIDHLDFSDLTGGSSLTVNEGNDVFIVTNKITFGAVKVVGEGSLTIYVKPGANTFNPTTNGTIFGRVDHEERLVIYVDTMSGVNDNNYHIIFPNNSKTGAYVMFENARVQFSQNATFNGAIYTGAVNGNVNAVTLNNNANISEGNGRALIVATNGKVYMANNSSLSGAVIAVDYEQGNGGQSVIRFDPDMVHRVPPIITSPVTGNTPVSEGRKLKVGPTIER